MSIKVLACTEATYLNTGYAVYFRELLKALHANPAYEVGEFASWASPNDGRIYDVPWKLYCNEPDRGNPSEVEQYNQNEHNKFGVWKFEAVCNDFRPNVVLSIRDNWMDSFIDMSPFRKCFKWIWMPTVDAARQNPQWIEMYSRCDAVLTYNDWSGHELVKDSAGRIKWLGSAPPPVDKAYMPQNRKQIKQGLGFEPDCKIIGTVMRNQRRKLFPDLFESFRKYLDNTGDKNTYLYCHTSYPDGGWEIPDYLKMYNLCSKTIFTYVCEKCRHTFPSFFQDSVTFCPKCGQPAATMANVQNGASSEVMSVIYNLFDLYIQYANSEGYGIPLAEAASCAVPIMAINYSAMSDILEKLGGIPVNYLALTPEIETGCLRAVPDNNHCAEQIEKFFALPEEERTKLGQLTYTKTKEHLSLEKTVGKWQMAIEMVGHDNLWDSPPSIHQPNENVPQNLSNKDFVRWLIVHVLGEPERLNTHMELRMVKDLNFGVSLGGLYGMYYNEDSAMFNKTKYEKFHHQDAYEHMKRLCERRNYWEKQRCGIQ